MKLSVRVPATVANLGPGFDSMALAVDLANEATLDTDAAPGVTVEGEGAGELPADASNLLLRSMAYLATDAGRDLPPFRLACRNQIPLQSGLGSSAAAVVAGLLLADHVLGTKFAPDRLLEMAADLEGHADNAAAALRGGVAIAYLSSTGWRAVSVDPAAELRPVLLVSVSERVSTEEARRVLTREIPRVDAAFNASRAALLVLALTSRPDLLADALEDRLHQQARLKLAPASRALFADLREAGLPVCVAGAGPSLLAFEREGHSVQDLGPGWRVLRTRIDPRGAKVRQA